MNLSLFRPLERVVAAVLLFLSVTVPVSADDVPDITRVYDAFNSTLVSSGFLEANRLFEAGRVREAARALQAADTGGLRGFYSRQLAESNAACYTRSRCRESDLTFLSVLAFSDYEIVSVEPPAGGSSRMGVRGINGAGADIKLVVGWVHENGAWKIDRLMKVPASWNIRFE